MIMIKISLKYDTAWGENLVLSSEGRRMPMKYRAGGVWDVVFEADEAVRTLAYSFLVERDGEVIRKEWRSHSVKLAAGYSDVEIHDRWIDRPHGSAFFSSAFTKVIFAHASGKEPSRRGNLTFRVTVPEVRRNQVVAVAGSGDKLGWWNRFHPLFPAGFPTWELTVHAKEAFEYKFVILDGETMEPVLWETGPDHFFPGIQGAGKRVVVADAAPVFRTVPWRGAGVAVPVFSLRTSDSFGTGEFHDLKKLVDWAVATGQNFIQLLPVNDTTMTGTWQDSYPYNAVSSFALHPQLLHLPSAGVRQDKAYREMKASLEALPAVNYEAVNSAKLRMMRKLFQSKGETTLASGEFRSFLKDNDSWLLPYAVFCVLRDINGTCDFSTWGKYSRYSRAMAEKFAAAHSQEVDFYRFLQFHLDAQLKDAVAYAHRCGVAIKGDLPIGVSRTSADAWASPELFNMDMQAGAPPDAFSADGQNWGFPTYNWERMEEDGFAWWKARLRKMSDYFDAFRIDHILGFFRIWEIPAKYRSGLMGHFNPALPYSADELRIKGFDPSVPGIATPGDGGETDVLFVEDPRRGGWYHPRILGADTVAYSHLEDWRKSAYDALYEDFFYHRHNAFWKETAMRKLPALLRSTGMLACGEDLGMIPSCVPEVMDELNILSLEIQRMPKDPKDDFADPSRYPYFCVCATGTHDTSPLRAWWEEDRSLTQKFYSNMMHRGGGAPWFCEPWVAEDIVEDHLASPAMLVVLPLQDWLAIDGRVRYQGNPADERINIPAIPRHYWRYRMHCTLESLIADQALCSRIRSMVYSSGRGV